MHCSCSTAVLALLTCLAFLPLCALRGVLCGRRVVFDEGHTLKNASSSTTKAAVAISAPNRWVVTGTPIGGEVTDLQGQFAALQLWPFNVPSWFMDNVSLGIGGLTACCCSMRRARARVCVWCMCAEQVLLMHSIQAWSGDSTQCVWDAGFAQSLLRKTSPSLLHCHCAPWQCVQQLLFGVSELISPSVHAA